MSSCKKEKKSTMSFLDQLSVSSMKFSETIPNRRDEKMYGVMEKESLPMEKESLPFTAPSLCDMLWRRSSTLRKKLLLGK